MALADEAIALPCDSRCRICITVLLHLYRQVKVKDISFCILTIFDIVIQHDVGHVLDIVEPLRLEVAKNVSNEFFLSPDEEHTFFHDVGWDDESPEHLDRKKIFARLVSLTQFLAWTKSMVGGFR